MNNNVDKIENSIKHNLLNMLVIQRVLEHEKLSLKRKKQLEKEKNFLLNNFREELQQIIILFLNINDK